MSNDYFFDLNEVMRISGLKRSTIYKYMDEGFFPKPMKMGSRKIAWNKEDIQKWLKSKGIENSNIQKKDYADGYDDALQWVKSLLTDKVEHIGSGIFNYLCDLINTKTEGKM